jgi:putative peptidoglycan lipid II flippase
VRADIVGSGRLPYRSWLMPAGDPPRRTSGAAALVVAAGIFLSRIAGFLRTRAMAHYLGQTDAADAFSYALRIPNVLQNLFGEGVLSASFIPVYARLIEEKRDDEARKVAGAVLSLLFFIVSALVLLGILAAPLLVDIFAGGYSGAKRELCIRLVRIVFPGTGLLVLSAWCLGVLNSHRRFFLSYVAPVLWNLAIIVALILEGRGTSDLSSLATAAAFGAVAGSALQLLLQLPAALIVLRGLRLSLGRGSGEVRSVGRSFGPVVLGRGVVQVSSWVDSAITSFLLTGAMSGLTYAQTLYQLPISLFGMAVSAAELPEMARALGDPQAVAARLQERLTHGLRRMSYFVVPTAVAFILLGDAVVGLVYRTGRFGAEETRFVWAILAAFSLGLPAVTQARLYSSSFYALRDTVTPFRIAMVRVVFGIAIGVALAFGFPALLGTERRWGVVGLALAGALAGWLEMLLLRHALGNRLGAPVRMPGRFLGTIVLAALLAGASGWLARLGLQAGARALGLPLPALVESAAVLLVFGVLYLLITTLFRVEEAGAVVNRVRRRLRRP